MNWIALHETGQLESLKENSNTRPQVIFKHSTRCGTSQLIKGRLERNKQPAAVDFYFLDLIAHRQISNAISETFHVPHESPQILLIRNGECIFHESHLGISMDEIEEKAM
jgi:bacillithiol system protein YtxJ